MNLPRLVTVLLLTALLFSHCTDTTGGSQQAELPSAKPPPDEKNLEDWKSAFNNDAQALLPLYIEQAVKVTPQGKVITGNEAIVQSWKAFKTGGMDIETITTIKAFPADKQDRYSYEIGTFSTSAPNEYYQLIIWNNATVPAKRELEFIAPASDPPATIPAIDEARQKWITLCNLHQASRLVSEMYTDNAVYYNHKPVITGTVAITEEYAYMNGEQYSLQLTPLITQPVSDSLALEVGQCSGTYKGRYVIIWKKDEMGNWKVLMDSNI